MANPLPPKISKGTIGELLVQLRLLQYGVQAAPPIKDSGNDLIAVKGEVFKAIQVKTSSKNILNTGNLRRIFHILALVKLVQRGEFIYLDQSEIYLLRKKEAKRTQYRVDELKGKELTQDRINELFS